MPVPNTMADLSQTAGSNYPVGSEPIGNNLDNYLRSHAAIIKSTNSVASTTMPSGSTVNVALADGEAVVITGAATINSLGTGFVGCRRELRTADAAKFAHSAALQLPGSRDITAAAGQAFTFRCIAAGVWSLVSQSVDVAGIMDAIASKQPALGFTPVQQIGDNRVGLEWDGSLFGYYVNGAYTGQLATVGYVSGNYQSALGYTPYNKAGGSVLGDVDIRKNSPMLSFISESGTRGWRQVASISTEDYGFFLERFNGSTYQAMMSVGTDGSVTAAGNITAFSDIRLKSDIRPLEGALGLVRRLQGVRYTKDGKESIGFIAQHYGEVLPELRHVDADGMQSIAYGNTTAVLVEAVKELDARLSKLEDA